MPKGPNGQIHLPEDKAECAVAFARDLRKRSNPEKGLPADKAFFDDLSGEGEGSDRKRS